MNKYRWRRWPYCSDPGLDRQAWDHQSALLRQEAWDEVSVLEMVRTPVRESELVSGPASDEVSAPEMVRIPVRESELVPGPASGSVLGLGQVSEWVAASRHRVPNTNYADQV